MVTSHAHTHTHTHTHTCIYLTPHINTYTHKVCVWPPVCVVCVRSEAVFYLGGTAPSLSAVIYQAARNMTYCVKCSLTGWAGCTLAGCVGVPVREREVSVCIWVTR